MPDTWTPPKGLDAPVPRAVRLSAGLKIGSAIAPLLWAFTMFYILYDGYQTGLLRERGVDGTAIVTSRYLSGKRLDVHNFSYRFETRDAVSSPSKTVGGSGVVSEIEYRAVAIGQMIPIIYDPIKPERSRINFENSIRFRSRARMLDALKVFSLMWLGIWTFMQSFLVPIYLRERFLLRWGSIARAQILGEEPPRSFFLRGSKSISKVNYSFIDSTGARVEGTQNITRAGQGNRPNRVRAQLLDNPVVLYDPENSAKNKLYPLRSVALRR